MENRKNMKSNMVGAINTYREMFKRLMEWGEPMGRHNSLYSNGTHKVLQNNEEHFIDDLDHVMSDMGFHGWIGDAGRNERDINKRIETAYYCLVKALSDAIGYDYEEYDPESPMYKYHLKDLDVDKVLSWREEEGGEE